LTIGSQFSPQPCLSSWPEAVQDTAGFFTQILFILPLMAVKTPIDYTQGIYFITFTCQDWLPLFEITNSYDTVYKWFDCLKPKGHLVKGYVIMPKSFTCTN